MMKHLLITLLLASWVAHAAEPFVVFAADAAYSDPATLPVLQKYLSSQDYLGYRAILNRPELKDIVLAAHYVEISASLDDLNRNVQFGCGAPSPTVLFYQWGVPASAPPGEIADPLGSVAQASAMVHAAGCQKFGLLPEGHFFVVTNCAVDLDASIYQQVNWSTVDFLDLTGGKLLSDDCAGKSSSTDYVNLARTIVSYVRARNPKIIVAAHLSFGSIQAETMVEAVHELTGVVDGFLLAYPLSPFNDHRYSNARNLETVLSSLRSP